jgi:pyrroloquinoline quinone biosynthesis protein B
MIRIHVLGSAAGGGFPQWNCGCPNCRGVREGTIAAKPRTQASVAVSTDSTCWFLINASPEIRAQIESFPCLHPQADRHSPIAGILLNNGDLDQCLGLLSLREAHPLQIYATDRVRHGFTEDNILYRTLERFPGQVTWHTLKVGSSEQVLLTPEGAPSGLTVTAVPIPGKVPLHVEGRITPDREDNIGLIIRDIATGRRLAYLPAVAARNREVVAILQEADGVFFDGTFWASDELTTLGVGERRAEEMAHWPLSGPTGSLRMLSTIRARQRILIHINNTNPILREDSLERREVSAAGVEVAYDGMEVML